MRSREIRSSFLEFFRRHGHIIVPSSSLVPHDDPTLLFTNAGMNQFKDVFLGREKRAYTRATSSQKCMRVSGKHNDLDTVGPSLRHHTFFEMLGNFSFGDYFKREAIAFAWELLTEVWKLSPERLYPTIFRGDALTPRDDEAFDAWRSYVPAERIGELGADDNFWQMGDTGPCGRCSEIYYYRGPHIACDEERAGKCRGLECSCDRYIEIWNNVFMEFARQADGTLKPLPAPSIDTGMGLERVTAVIQDKLSNYDTDVFTPILAALEKRTARPYRGTDEPSDVSMRVIADHLRAMTFLIADGVVPSNEHRGYVLRKIMRRAMRHGKKLGFDEPFLYELGDVVVSEMGDAYPELRTGRDAIVRVVRSEEDRFDAVLTAGLPRLEDVLDRAAAGTRVVPGEEAFKLYDSLGVPMDFIEDLAEQRHISIDREGFEREMAGQRRKARAGSAFKAGTSDISWTTLAGSDQKLQQVKEEFVGYDSTRVSEVPILALFNDAGHQVETIEKGRTRLRGTPEDAVLPRGRRTGLRHRRHRQPVGQRSRHRSRSNAELAATAPGRSVVGNAPFGRHGVGRGVRRRAGCHATEPHRHSPAARGAETSPRCARQAVRLAGCSRPVAIRLRSFLSGDLGAARGDRAHREPPHPPERARSDGGAIHRGGYRVRCDGALRRKVW